MIIKIILISFIVTEIWILSIVYKNEYNLESKRNKKLLNELFNLLKEIDVLRGEKYEFERELLLMNEKNSKLLEDNKKLKEKIVKQKGVMRNKNGTKRKRRKNKN